MEDKLASSVSEKLGLDADGVLDQRYRIVRLLGKGGMGAVYFGEHVGLKRSVAVKVLHAEFATFEEHVRRFQREAQVAATLRHPNIVEVFDVGVAKSGEPYLVMEYLEGESLRDLMTRHPRLDAAAACAVLEPVLLALEVAHRKEIVHRDLKPENVFLASRPGEPMVVKIIDFGISKMAGGEPDRWRTQTGMVLGTPNYMSPEQARGAAHVDRRADLYAVGAILYEMMTGGLPYTGASFAELYSRLLTEEPRPPRSVFPGLDADVEPVLVKAIARDPAMRFQSATEMLDALAALPAFKLRSQRAGLFGSSQAVRTFAVGDLGPVFASSLKPAPTGTQSAADRSASAPAARTAPTPAAGADLDADAGPPTKRSWLLVASLGLVALLAIAVVALLLRTPAPTVSAVPAPASLPAPPTPAPTVPTVIAPSEESPPKPAKAAGKVAHRRVEPAEEEAAASGGAAAEDTGSNSGGLGSSLKALGADLVQKARSQVKRIPDPRSK